MRFDSTGNVVLSADTGDPVAIFRPEIRIMVYGPRGSREVRALVDTGADNSVLSEQIARDLGIQLLRGKGLAARAFGGQEIALSYSDVELELVHAEGNLRWLARVYFLAGGTDEEAMVLGHQGFLDFFTATFIGEECVLDVEGNSYLPRIR